MGVLVMHGLEGRQRTSREPQHGALECIVEKRWYEGEEDWSEEKAGRREKSRARFCWMPAAVAVVMDEDLHVTEK